jgi:hypothetical protein
MGALMRRFVILGLALVASLAVGAPTAGATSDVLTLSQSGATPLVPGDPYVFLDETFSPWGVGLFVDLGDKEVTCRVASVQGFVVTNERAADELRITKGEGGECSIVGTGEAATVTLNGPLRLKLTAIGLAGISKYEHTTPTLKVTGPKLTCTFQASKLEGFFNQTTVPERLTVNFRNRMHRVAHEGTCPRETNVGLQLTYGYVSFFGEIFQVVNE